MSWPKVDIILNAIKNSGAQTITDLKPTVEKVTTDLKPTIEKVTTDLKPTIDGIKTNFDEWKVPWTQDRAEKIDNLDVGVSTRADSTSVKAILSSVGSVYSRDLTTVMGRLGSMIGYGELVVYDLPGSYTFTVPDGVVKLNVAIAGGGGRGGACVGKLTSGATVDATEDRASDEWPYENPAVFYVVQGSSGGNGAYMEIEIDVSPGQKYQVVVGDEGGASSFDDYVCTGGANGLNGIKSFRKNRDALQYFGSGDKTTRSEHYRNNYSNKKISGGQAIGTANPQVKKFINGENGVIGGGMSLEYRPIITGSKPKSRSFPAEQGHTFDVSRFKVAQKSESTDYKESNYEYPKPEIAQNRVFTGRTMYFNEYPQIGQGGAGGTPGTLASVKSGRAVNAGDYYSTPVTLTSNSTDGLPGEPGGPGIVVINY